MHAATERDWTTLNKGDSVSQAECEEILGATRDQAIYSIRMMQLVSDVSRQLSDAGKRCHVCQRDGGLYVLTDEETPDFTMSSLERARRQINRAHMVNQYADRSQMSAAAKRKHERSLVVGAAYTQALARERRKLAEEEDI